LLVGQQRSEAGGRGKRIQKKWRGKGVEKGKRRQEKKIPRNVAIKRRSAKFDMHLWLWNASKKPVQRGCGGAEVAFSWLY
jgi:hypothetical protein